MTAKLVIEFCSIVTGVDPDDTCSDILICSDPNSACVSGTCTCNDGFVLEGGVCIIGKYVLDILCCFILHVTRWWLIICCNFTSVYT